MLNLSLEQHRVLRLPRHERASNILRNALGKTLHDHARDVLNHTPTKLGSSTGKLDILSNLHTRSTSLARHRRRHLHGGLALALFLRLRRIHHDPLSGLIPYRHPAHRVRLVQGLRRYGEERRERMRRLRSLGKNQSCGHVQPGWCCPTSGLQHHLADRSRARRTPPHNAAGSGLRARRVLLQPTSNGSSHSCSTNTGQRCPHRRQQVPTKKAAPERATGMEPAWPAWKAGRCRGQPRCWRGVLKRSTGGWSVALRRVAWSQMSPVARFNMTLRVPRRCR